MATLQDMQSLGYGKKKSGMEQLNTILTGVMQAQQANRQRSQEDNINQAKMRAYGYQQQPQQGGLAELLSSILGTQQGYQYTGAPTTALEQSQINRNDAYSEYMKNYKQSPKDPNKIYVLDPNTGELIDVGSVPGGSKVYKKNKSSKKTKSVDSDPLGLFD